MEKVSDCWDLGAVRERCRRRAEASGRARGRSERRIDAWSGSWLRSKTTRSWPEDNTRTRTAASDATRWSELLRPPHRSCCSRRNACCSLLFFTAQSLDLTAGFRLRFILMRISATNESTSSLRFFSLEIRSVTVRSDTTNYSSWWQRILRN